MEEWKDGRKERKKEGMCVQKHAFIHICVMNVPVAKRMLSIVTVFSSLHAI